MKSSRLLWVVVACFFLSFSTVFAHADSVPGDPVMQVDDPQCTGTQVVTPGQIFTFSAGGPGPTAGGGCTGFVAAAGNVDTGGQTITSLDIQTFDPNITDPKTQVTCLSNAFAGCQATPLSGGVVDIFLTQCSLTVESCGKGIAPGQNFSINLSNLLLDESGNRISDPNDPGAFETQSGGGWIVGEEFAGIADPTGGDATTPFITAPEPSSLFLLATGIAALGRMKKLLKPF